MRFWLLKSEPSEYSWYKMEVDKVAEWDGVCNYQAQNYMKAMKLGDLAFFYHTGKEKAILGIVEILKEHYYIQPPVIQVADTGIHERNMWIPASRAGMTPEQVADNLKFGLVDVKFSRHLNNQVTLYDIKQNPLLKNIAILKQPRLSVSPVSEFEWNEIIRMSE